MKKTMQLDFTNQLAHIAIGELDGQQVITKTWGRGFGWTPEDAKHVITMRKTYVSELTKAGIDTSTTLDEKIIPSENNEYLIQSIETYYPQGDLLVNLMKSGSSHEFLNLAETQLSSMTQLLFSIAPLRRKQYAVDWLWMSVPIDLKPQNVVQSDVDIILVDTFRPQLWEESGIVLEPMPSIHPDKQKIPHDEAKTGDIRFQAGRLFGYYVAIATRWQILQNKKSSLEELDSFRRELASKIVHIVRRTLEDHELFSTEVISLLIADVQEIADESIRDGSYEGPRYVKALYESEEAERSNI